MNTIQLFSVSMWTTVLSAGGVSLWLWSRRRQEPALKALSGFCLSMAIWCFGHILVLEDHQAIGTLILLGNPLMPTAFLHFVLLWLGDPLELPQQLRRLAPLFYFTAIAVVLASWLTGGGYISPWMQFDGFFHLAFTGWLNLAYTVAIGVVGHLLLLMAFQRSRGNLRRSITAMFITGGWGFVLSTSFIFPSLDINLFPYAMLALPSYAVLVVYSVVRYRLVEVNRWVNQAVIWLAMLATSMLAMSLILALLAPLGLAELAQAPLSQLVVYSGILLVFAWLAYGPAKEFADRLVYPGAVLDKSTLDQWVTRLNAVRGWGELRQTAEQLWLKKSGVTASVNIDGRFECPQGPVFVCEKRDQWDCRLQGWEDVAPSHQRLAEFMAKLLPSACATLERSLLLAEAERKRLEQQHLVELGGLTAAIAHELRNPLNIITMAAAQTDPRIREHISKQVERAELLIKDVLTYAGQIRLNSKPTNLCALTAATVAQIRQLYEVEIELEVPDEVWLSVDPQRLQQVLINLLDNAAAFVRQTPQGKILVALAQDERGALIAIHNNGPAVPDAMKPRLFQAFVSKRAGGSGLGLAIVRRIVDAHGGDVWHSDEEGWPVSFMIHLPLEQDEKETT
ncbi:ATP-binding protein [Hahella aquimaris]|uniref:sensor histidine kinase n=1 Tax=Hahella sp. HNIBRBA332 TaxID=3015983 RepID=UPI00273AF743|nr:ATP-binding protein [Hahella sp. HNIBRBA332]WLQ12522.1 ATP-binding protein [Hahella sp. HNIBRBA332]